jgi:hypothetical protein
MINAAGGVRAWLYSGVPESVAESSAEITGRKLVAVALSEARVLTVVSAGTDRLSLDEGALDGDLHRTEVLWDVSHVRALALSPSGGIMVLACDDGTLRGVDIRTREAVWTLRTGESLARAVALASDAGPVVAALADGTIRRYDLTGDSLDVTGPGPAVRGVAVTPDRAVIVAGCADGTLLRWSARDGGPPRIWRIAAAITAVAVGGGGDRVLAAADDGKVRLYDFAAGESYSFAAGDARAVAPAQPSGPPAPGSVRGLPGPAARVVDDDVHFAVYRPKALSPDDWATMLVFAHKTSLVEQPGKPPMDPNEQVQARAWAQFGDSAAPPAGADARYELPRGSQLRVVPELPGIQCNPAEAVFEWWEPVHEAEFSILAPQGLAGSVVRGSVRIWRGPLIVAEVFIAIPVTTAQQAGEAPKVADSAPPYRKIFASYSHDDLPLLASFTEAAWAIGDTVLLDLTGIHSGELWEPRLLEMIEEADIFQLFWSSNSMRSPFCRQEWEYALSLGRQSFVRPVYWESPLPQDLVLGLPPPNLRALQFVPVRLFVPKPADQDAEVVATVPPPGPPAPSQTAGAEDPPTTATVPPSPLPPPYQEKPPPLPGKISPPASIEWPQPSQPPAPGLPPGGYDQTDDAQNYAPAQYWPGSVAGSPEVSAPRRRSRRPVLVAALVLVAVVIAVLIALHAFG